MHSHLAAFNALQKSVLNANHANAIAHPDFPKMLKALLDQYEASGGEMPQDNDWDQVIWFLSNFSSWTEEVRVPACTGELRNCIFVDGVPGCNYWTGTGFLGCS